VYIYGGPKKRDHRVFFKIAQSEINRFYYFLVHWRNRRNITSDDYKFIHRTCKM